MTDIDTIVDIRGVRKSFGGVQAVRDVTFTVPARTLTALIGPNGAGKSSLFNVLSGFEHADAGEVQLLGRPTVGMPPERVAQLGVGRTFQHTKTYSAMTVLDNLLVGAKPHAGSTIGGALFARGKAKTAEREATEKARDLLEAIGLSAKADHYAANLSGGQQKLLEFARVLMRDPELVLLDEPLAGVNPTLGVRLMEKIAELREQRGTTILFIEHNLPAVMRFANRVVCMAEGTVIAQGSPREVRDNPKVIAAYVGGSEGDDHE